MIRRSAITIFILHAFASLSTAGEKVELVFGPPANASVTYAMRQTSATDLKYVQDEGTENIADNTSLESDFTITRTGERDNEAEYTLNIDTLRLTRHFGTGAENYRLEVDGDKTKLYRNGRLYADTESNLRLDVISDDQRALSVTKRPVRILIKPDGRIEGAPETDNKDIVIIRFFAACINQRTALFGFHLPDGPVVPGGNWAETFIMDDVGRITFTEGAKLKSTFNYRFERIENRGGRRLAIISLDAPLDVENLSATMQGFNDKNERVAKPIRIMKLKRKLTGTLTHDLDDNRPVRVEIRGETEISILAGARSGAADDNSNASGKDSSDGKKFTPMPPPNAPVISLVYKFQTLYEEKK